MGALNYLAPFQALGQMGLQQAQIEHTQAMSRLGRAEAQKAETAAAADAAVAARMRERAQQPQSSATAGEGKPRSMADAFYEAGMDYMQMGDPGKGIQAVQLGSQMEARESLAAYRKAEIAKVQAAQRKSALEEFDRILESATGPMEWEAGKQSWIQAHPEAKDDPVAQRILQLPYSPEAVQRLRDFSTTAKQKIDVELKQQEQALRKADLERKARHDRVMEGLAEERNGIARTREARLTKAGGKTAQATGPNAALIKQSTSIAARLFPDLGDSDSDQVKELAMAAANRAAQELRANPGLDRNTAIYRAVRAEGKNVVRDPASKFLGIPVGKSKTGYKGPEGAIQIPAGATAATLQKGQLYETARGPAVWDGKMFQPQETSPGMDLGEGDPEDGEEE